MKALKISLLLLMLFSLTTAICYGRTAKDYCDKGIDHGVAGEFKKAQQQFTKALEAEPFYVPARIYLNLSEDALRQRIKVEVALYLFKGIAYANKGAYDEAIAEHKKALEINPNYAVAHTRLGVAYANKGMLDEAIAEWKKALEIDPNYAVAHNNLAVAYHRKEKYSLAVKHCDRAIELGWRVHLELLELLELHRKGDFGEIVKVREKPEKGFHWPYYLYVPDSVRNLTKENELNHLLVIPNNTGRSDDSTKIHDDSAKITAQTMTVLANYLGVPLLVPTFPRLRRYRKIYTHCLDRDSILTRKKKLKRIDLQLIAMIDDSIESLSSKGINLDKKVLMMGFSAAGCFVNRFVVIHPKRVRAAAIGAPGWPIAPVGEWNGVKLRYPLGVWDLHRLVKQAFDLESFKSVPLYFFMGDQDTNDPVPYRDGYDPKDERLIFKYFGRTPVARWPVAEKIYKSVGCSSQFVLSPGIGHTISDKMRKDVKGFFLKNLEPHQDSMLIQEK